MLYRIIPAKTIKATIYNEGTGIPPYKHSSVSLQYQIQNKKDSMEFREKSYYRWKLAI